MSCCLSIYHQKKALEEPGPFQSVFYIHNLVRGAFVPVFLFRQDFEGVLWWMLWDCPFQGIGPFVPRIVCIHLAARKDSPEYYPDE